MHRTWRRDGNGAVHSLNRAGFCYVGRHDVMGIKVAGAAEEERCQQVTAGDGRRYAADLPELSKTA
jgi:hypothetical protein